MGTPQLNASFGSPARKRDPLWDVLLFEAAVWAQYDPQAAPILSAAILSHNSLEEVLAALVGNKLSSPFLQATQVCIICE
jgi:hypothetical protein